MSFRLDPAPGVPDTVHASLTAKQQRDAKPKRNNRLSRLQSFKLYQALEIYIASKPDRKTWSVLADDFSNRLGFKITKDNIEAILKAANFDINTLVCREHKSTPFGVVSHKVYVLEGQMAQVQKELAEIRQLLS